MSQITNKAMKATRAVVNDSKRYEVTIQSRFFFYQHHYFPSSTCRHEKDCHNGVCCAYLCSDGKVIFLLIFLFVPEQYSATCSDDVLRMYGNK